MKNAIIAALVAALVSSGATLAATRINGRAIAPHSIPQNRLTSAAVNTLMSRPALVTASGQVPNVVPGVDGQVPVTTIVATCPTGDSAVSGGYTLTNLSAQPGFVVYSDGPTADGTSWELAVAQKNPGDPSDVPAFTVSAGCVAVA